MQSESRFLLDVRREPAELRALVARLLGPRRAKVEEAARLVRAATPGPLWIAGMGSSFHGGHAVQSFFDAAGRVARVADAGELVHFVELARGATLLVLSRSGRSVEVVELLGKARRAGAKVVGVTNDSDSPLAKESDVAVELGAASDGNVGVTMYSGVAFGGALVAALALGVWRDEVERELDRALRECESRLESWRAAIEASGWCGDADARSPAAPILLARGSGLAAALEARQLFEEAAKLPASAHSTGAFRHGPNEVVGAGARVVLWLAEHTRLRELDLRLARDLRGAGARVALIGTRLETTTATRGAADLALELPDVAPAWRFLVELAPARLLVERVARRRGVDCDRFRHCPHVVTSEEGLGEGA